MSASGEDRVSSRWRFFIFGGGHAWDGCPAGSEFSLKAQWTMSRLFTPIQVGQLELRNRIIIAPMCQYSAEEGCATDWHLIHLGNLALSGAGLLTIEATAVTPEGRISPDDLGLWNDANEAALERVLKGIRQCSDMPIAIQLAHRRDNNPIP